MFNINFQLLAHIKDFRLLTPRQSSFYQLRLTVYQQPTIKYQKSQQLIPYLILTPQTNKGSINNSNNQINNNESAYKKQNDSSITGHYLKQHSQPVIINQSSQPHLNNSNFNRMNSLDVQFQTNQTNKRNSSIIGQIDMETNSFLTKPFLVQKADQIITIDQVIVFKGSMEIAVNNIIDVIKRQQQQQQQNNSNNNNKNQQSTTQQPTSQPIPSTLTSTKQQKQKLPSILQKNILTSLYISCQLFLVSSYSTQSIGQWAGYTLTQQGNILLPVSFFTYNSSYSLVDMTFLTTKIQFISLQKSRQNNIFIGKSGQQQVNKIVEYLVNKYSNLSNIVLNVPEQYLISSHQLLYEQKLKKKQKQNALQTLFYTLNQYNQKTHRLWQRYQQYIQQTILSKGKLRQIVGKINQQKLLHYKQTLKLYHWKHHVILNQIIGSNNNNNNMSIEYKHLVNQITKIKANPYIDKQLIFYPFSQHHRTLKINNQDLVKIIKINSLSLINPLNINTNKQPKSQTINTQQPPKYHLLIFVHGYQASSYDMQNLASFLKYKKPQTIRTFISSCNQGRTQQPIEQSGHRLAIQIKNYINNKFEHDKELIEISFICHSMGGLIVRAALKYLQLYKNKFRTYLSLCSPHLGYLYHSSALIKTSLWVLNQVKKDPSMIQLSMQDNPVLQKTYLYDLSKKTQLQWFKYPIFIGSRQDEYVPFWSALVQDKQFYFQTKDAKIYKELYKNLTEHIENKIIRLQTVYQDKINDISSFVGRTAHIRILNCIQIMEMIYLLVEGAF